MLIYNLLYYNLFNYSSLIYNLFNLKFKIYSGGNRGGGGGGGGGRKNGEPDLEEKFGRFEIKPQTRPGGPGGHNMSMMGAAGSEQGDETVSMVSDTW